MAGGFAHEAYRGYPLVYYIAPRNASLVNRNIKKVRKGNINMDVS